jgi:rare lipoprotein A (peptidoglycan hydrolase)
MKKRLLVSMILATISLQAVVIEASEPIKPTFLTQEYLQPTVINVATPAPTSIPKVRELPKIKIGTPPPSKKVVIGRASWYNVGRGYYAAAGPDLRIGSWRGRVVEVCNTEKCIKVKIIDWCQCYRNEPTERIIDLSADAFAALFPLSRGLGKVTVKW